MHEVSIMAEAVRIAVETAELAGARAVTSIKLRVGSLSSAVPEALHFAWGIVRSQTIAEHAALEIELVPATGWCAACQIEFACETVLHECPRCHELSGELRQGHELEIAAVEIE